MVDLAANIWADGPASAPYQPPKKDIRDWGAWLEGVVNAFTSNGGLVYASRSLLLADLAHGANTMAWVVGDSTVANNGIYAKTGVTGAGSWNRIADLPYSFIIATDAGAGSSSAILATSSLPVSGSTLVWLTIFETNVESPVTISFNGGIPLTIKTNGGNDPIVGGLVGGTTVLGIRVGSSFRLVSDQASAAILAACEAAEAAASDYADFARNNWAVIGPFIGTGVADDLYPLTIDPGSPNNMFPIVGGFSQMISSGAYQLVYVSGAPKIKITVPLGVPFEVRVSNAITVGTPGDGSVTDLKLASPQLRAISALSSAADELLYATGSNAWSLTAFTALARSLLGSASQLAMRKVIGAEKGYLYGLQLSNNATDVTNDLDFSAGECCADNSNALILLPATTKQLDVAWNTGTGGRFDSAISDGTWHIFVISDGAGNFSAGYSKSLVPTAAANYPATYVNYRRILSLNRVSGAWQGFVQFGDKVTLKTQVIEFVINNPGTSVVNRSLSAVPVGLPVLTDICAILANGAAAVLPSANIYQIGVTSSSYCLPGTANGSGRSAENHTNILVVTNSSGQVATVLTASDTNCALQVITLGWTDLRGRM